MIPRKLAVGLDATEPRLGPRYYAFLRRGEGLKHLMPCLKVAAQIVSDSRTMGPAYLRLISPWHVLTIAGEQVAMREAYWVC